MMKIVWTDPAIADLENIRSYIAQDSSIYADALLLEFFNAVDHLEHFPKSGRTVPELDEKDTRELIVGNYRIVYDIVNLEVRILGVLHGARLFQNPKTRKQGED